MTTTLWIFLALAIFLVLGFALVMHNLFLRGREDEKHINYRKVRKWKDDDEKE